MGSPIGRIYLCVDCVEEYEIPGEALRETEDGYKCCICLAENPMGVEVELPGDYNPWDSVTHYNPQGNPWWLDFVRRKYEGDN